MRGIPVKGHSILETRKSLGLTQEQLAAQAHCDVKTIRKAEKSQPVDSSILKNLADALGVEQSAFVDTASAHREQHVLEVALSWLNAFNTRDPVAVAELYHAAGSVTVMADPKLPGGGQFLSREGVQQWASVCFEAMITEPMTSNMFQIDVAGDYVILRSIVAIQVTSLLTHRSVGAAAAHEFQIQEGKILSHRIFADSDAIASLFRDTAQSEIVVTDTCAETPGIASSQAEEPTTAEGATPQPSRCSTTGRP